MGNSYTNITLLGPTRERLAEVLRRLEWHAYVSPTVDGVTTVYEFASETLQPEVIKDLAGDLSDAFDCPALAVVNERDGVLSFWLFEAGRQTVAYDSCPSYFWGDHLPPAGDGAGRLCAAFGAREAEPRVQEILAYDKLAPANRQSERYLSESERHADLLGALGLPPAPAGVGFCAIRDGHVPDGFNRDALSATWVDAPWAKLDRRGNVRPDR
jgi:hypothetical protein